VKSADQGRTALGGHRLGSAGYADPAQDLSPPWAVLDGRSRHLFRQAVGVDDAIQLRVEDIDTGSDSCPLAARLRTPAVPVRRQADRLGVERGLSTTAGWRTWRRVSARLADVESGDGR
jgi:hypothetical protein